MTRVNGAPLRAFLGSCPADGFTAPCPTCSAPMRSDGNACTGYPSHAAVRSLVMYATLSGTRANLTAQHAEGWRLLLGPDQLDRPGIRVPPFAWALDNGAWGCFQRGQAFDAEAFRQALHRWGDGADWVALPDIVAGGLTSLELSRSWVDQVAAYAPAYLVVQDGMTPADVAGFPCAGIFVGGSTAWKLGTLREWGAHAAAEGLKLHVGRVNSAQRVRACIDAGATSCDGTSGTRFSVNVPRLASATKSHANAPLFAPPVAP